LGLERAAAVAMQPAMKASASGACGSAAGRPWRRKRSQSMPDVPALAEQGFKGFSALAWWGIFAPAGTPKPILDKFHAELVKAIQSPSIAKKFADLGAEPLTISPQQFDAMVKGEIASNALVVKAAGVKVN